MDSRRVLHACDVEQSWLLAMLTRICGCEVIVCGTVHRGTLGLFVMSDILLHINDWFVLGLCVFGRPIFVLFGKYKEEPHNAMMYVFGKHGKRAMRMTSKV
jgi:hypothetical protein